jgi:anti-sigma regulatory factor (Ser/Thr protein kinase)
VVNVVEPVLWSRHILLPAELSSPRLARRFVALHLIEHGLESLREDVQLVVSELTTNAVVHAGTRFTVRLEARPDIVVLTVQDGSRSRPRSVAASVMDTSGRGLAIVARISHDWGLVEHAQAGKSIWASFTTRVDVPVEGPIE